MRNCSYIDLILLSRLWKIERRSATHTAVPILSLTHIHTRKGTGNGILYELATDQQTGDAGKVYGGIA